VVKEWSENTRCALLNPDDDGDPDQPVFAKQHGFSYALGIWDVQDIVANAGEK